MGESPWGFDSPLSHQHRDLLRGRISGLRVPCANPHPGYLTRLNLVVVGVRPLARVNIASVSLVSIFMSFMGGLERYRAGPAGGGGGGAPAGGGGMLEGAFAVLVQR